MYLANFHYKKNKGFETEMRNRKQIGFKLFMLIPKLETVLVVTKIETEKVIDF